MAEYDHDASMDQLEAENAEGFCTECVVDELEVENAEGYFQEC